MAKIKHLKKIILAVLIIGLSVVALWRIINNVTEPETPLVLEDRASATSNEIKDSVTNAAAKKPVKPAAGTLVDHKVPFTSQAPLGGWEDQRQQDGCEEASALMAVRWAQGKGINSLGALTEIRNASDYEQEKYGEYRDIALNDVIDWIFKDYFKYDKVSLKKNVSVEDIIAELRAGHVILAPMNGQILNNPYFTPPGPERHMLLIRGYDPAKREFITNDPGTKHGAAYRYTEKVLFNAITAYPTGYHEHIDTIEKNIIVVEK
jgi:hypothetical protein